jgi:ABC transporter with metal-binding/Fe-S-binding domain ATP-binding protein
MKVCALFSGGKDSVYATHFAQQQGYDVVCLLTMVSKNKESYMYHTLKIDKVPDIAKSLGIRIYRVETEGVKEEEVDDLMEALEELKEKEGIEGVVSGALASDYQRTRIEGICEELGLVTINPIWHVNPETYMDFVLEAGFDVKIVGVFAEGLEDSLIGKSIDKKLVERFRKHYIHSAGEGGEYETLVVDGPGFSKRLEL